MKKHKLSSRLPCPQKDPLKKIIKITHTSLEMTLLENLNNSVNMKIVLNVKMVVNSRMRVTMKKIYLCLISIWLKVKDIFKKQFQLLMLDAPPLLMQI